ncbi:hypothetical protein ALC57_14507 [Trachymyrmex cornetzi]|uniref:Uncharacterized protein n=1 Tax=Trachymyrmex cornetzi TaxID=471704 RepID=A0A151IYC9_9HYME|nr:hypothetical protein ALC57_14507 [Trachymyrmex cornetzi]
MWIQITKDIETKMIFTRNAVQCENRYKTILKRKVLSVKNNQPSGAKQIKVDFEEALNKIKAIGDSLEPEILQGPGRIVEKSAASTSSNSQAQKKKKTMSISETLLEIQKNKEEKRERRHQEKLDLLRTIITSLSRPNSENNK